MQKKEDKVSNKKKGKKEKRERKIEIDSQKKIGLCAFAKNKNITLTSS